MRTEHKNVPSALPDIVACGLSACLFVVNVVIDVNEPTWLTVASLVCFGLAIPFSVLPFFHLARYGKPKPGDAFYATTQVVDEGVYSIVRHPQYLGYSFLVLGFGCLDPNLLSVLLAGGAMVFFYIQAIVEERFCKKNLGTEYEDYSRKVPRMNVLLGLFLIVKKRLNKT